MSNYLYYFLQSNKENIAHTHPGNMMKDDETTHSYYPIVQVYNQLKMNAVTVHVCYIKQVK